MNVQQGYNRWAEQYDSNQNKTRDLEAISLQETLAGTHFDSILEIGCGTGKNSEWLQTISTVLTGIDLSEEMLAIARKKCISKQIKFVQADILNDWHFVTGKYDLITFSLVLEHIEDLTSIFEKASAVLADGGKIYMGELHPFKQYTGSKARFETENGTEIVPCFNHHISDFSTAAKKAGLEVELITEHFDDNDRSGIPRILTMLFSNR